jgi:hypothetical protein
MKLAISLFGMIIAMALSVCVMLFGWGLEVKSWGWVIWGSIGSAFIGAFFQAIVND